MVGCPYNWLILLVDSEKRVRNPFDGCSVLLYECLFTMIGLWLPLSEFEVAVLKYLKVASSQIQFGS